MSSRDFFWALGRAISYLFDTVVGQQDLVLEPRVVEIAGHKLRAEISGSRHAGVGRPTVVLVSGLNSPLENWDLVRPVLARSLRVVAYDRPGVGQSEPGSESTSPEQGARELRALLNGIAIQPPYLLVGHSLGGVFIRAFACLYPAEVAGLVYVDATDFTERREDNRRLWEALGPGEQGVAAMRKRFEGFLAEAPAGIHPEIELILRLWDTDFAELHALGAPPADVPIAVLLADKSEADSQGREMLRDLAVEEGAFHDAESRGLIARQSQWVTQVSRGDFAVTTTSGHYIQVDEPGLVVWGASRVLRHRVAGLLAQALERQGAAGVLAEYPALKQQYPAEVFDDALLYSLGVELLNAERSEEAITILQFNLQEYPDSWKTYYSLGEARQKRNEPELARQAYRQSLAFNPGNHYAAGMLKSLPLEEGQS